MRMSFNNTWLICIFFDCSLIALEWDGLVSSARQSMLVSTANISYHLVNFVVETSIYLYVPLPLWKFKHECWSFLIRSQITLYIILIPFMTLTSFNSHKSIWLRNFLKLLHTVIHIRTDSRTFIRWMFLESTHQMLSPEIHCSHGSWELQWSRNQQVPLSPLTAYHVNQLHSGLPPHMSWHWPAVTSCTMSRLLSSVMSQVPAVNTPHSSGTVVEVEGTVF